MPDHGTEGPKVKRGRPFKLTREQAQEIQDRWKARPTLKSLSAEYGLGESTITAIIAGKHGVLRGQTGESPGFS